MESKTKSGISQLEFQAMQWYQTPKETHFLRMKHATTKLQLNVSNKNTVIVNPVSFCYTIMLLYAYVLSSIFKRNVIQQVIIAGPSRRVMLLIAVIRTCY